MLYKLVSFLLHDPKKEALFKKISFLYETAKSNHSPKDVFDTLFQLHQSTKTATTKRKFTEINRELTKQLSLIKTSISENPHFFTDTTIEHLLGLELGATLCQSLASHDKELLNFFNTALHPEDYEVTSTRRLSSSIKKLVRQGDIFSKPIGTYFLDDDALSDHSSKHSLELYIPISKTKVAIFQGSLPPDLTTKDLPDHFQSRISSFLSKIGIKQEKKSGRTSPTSALFQSFFKGGASASQSVEALSIDSDSSSVGYMDALAIDSDEDSESGSGSISGSDSGSDSEDIKMSGTKKSSSKKKLSKTTKFDMDDDYNSDEDADYVPSQNIFSVLEDSEESASEMDTEKDKENYSGISSRTRSKKPGKHSGKRGGKPLAVVGKNIPGKKRGSQPAAKRRKLTHKPTKKSSKVSSQQLAAPKNPRYTHEFAEQFIDHISPSEWLTLSDQEIVSEINHGYQLHKKLSKLLIDPEDIESYMESTQHSTKKASKSEKSLARKINFLGKFFHQSSSKDKTTLLTLLVQESQLNLATMLFKSLDQASKIFITNSLPKWSKDPILSSSEKLSSSLVEQLEMAIEDHPFSAVERFVEANARYINPEGLTWARKEIQQISQMDPTDSTYHKKAQRLKLLPRIPFGKHLSLPGDVSLQSSASQRSHFLNSIRQRLDAAIYGHDDVKSKIVSIISHHLTNPDAPTKGFLLVGPPGTGKTSLVKAIAEAMGRSFGLIHLGGEPGRSMLVGHDFTYEGSEQGEVLRKIIESGAMNSVICFDEVDKLGDGTDGKAVSNQLIKLSDPTQNDDWRDRYMPDINFDLSKLLVIYTANYPDQVNDILKDRLEKVRIKPQTRHTKIQIAKNYLLPRLLQTFKFHADDLQISDEVITYLIDKMPYESGCRGLERKLHSLLSLINNLRLRTFDAFPSFSHKQSFSTASFFTPHFPITKQHVDEVLKDFVDRSQKIESTSKPGWINGLYACSVGGGILPMQVIVRSDLEKDISTGSLGDVMLQSIKVARTALKKLLPPQYLAGKEPKVHIHAIETAIPKDGPSAGGALTTALYSAITNQPIRNTTAVTGEIDVFGNITAIGGLYEKLQGAKKAGVTLAVVPEENRPEYEEVLRDDPDLIDASFQVRLVSRIEQILELMIVKPAQAPLMEEVA